MILSTTCNQILLFFTTKRNVVPTVNGYIEGNSVLKESNAKNSETLDNLLPLEARRPEYGSEVFRNSSSASKRSGSISYNVVYVCLCVNTIQ